MDDYKQKPDSYWKEKLTPEQYRVLRQKGTETPFTGEFYATDKDGMYFCRACGQKLFSSSDKQQSLSGWPSFSRAIDDSKIELSDDHSHGMYRIEVKCSRCGSHLGHVFGKESGLTEPEFCINSASLDFKDTTTFKEEHA